MGSDLLGYTGETDMNAEKISFQLKDFKKSPAMKLSVSEGRGVFNIGRLTFRQMGDGILYGLQCGAITTQEDVYGISPDEYDMDVSSCVLKDGYVVGLLLMRVAEGGILQPVMFFSETERVAENMRNMVVFSLKKAVEKYSPETMVQIKMGNERAKNLLEGLLGLEKGRKPSEDL